MSRVFSTSARRIKELRWKLNGTTEDVNWANVCLTKPPSRVGSPLAHLKAAAAHQRGQKWKREKCFVIMSRDTKDTTTSRGRLVDNALVNSSTKMKYNVRSKVPKVLGELCYP